MQYSNFNSIGKSISKLGFGLMRLPKKEENSEIIDRDEAFRLIDLAMKSGVNYYDTAYFYHGGDSEAFAREALSRYPRESFCLATKLPGSYMRDEGKHTEEIFNGQLEKCGVDYFDFYLLHAVNRDIMKTFEADKSYEYLTEQKKLGKIRYLGFSYHGDLEFFEELVDKYSSLIFRITYCILCNSYDAEDAVQETFLRYLTKAPEFNDEEHRKAWLIRVSANISKNMLMFRMKREAVNIDNIENIGIDPYWYVFKEEAYPYVFDKTKQFIDIVMRQILNF